MEDKMENQNNNDLFAIVVLLETKEGNKLVFVSAPTPDGRIGQNSLLMAKAKEENLPRLRISKSGRVTFLSAKDAFNAGRMKKLGKDYEDLTGTFEGSTYAEIAHNMLAGNHKDETMLTPEMVGDIDDTSITF
jgi:hypothetical protein